MRGANGALLVEAGGNHRVLEAHRAGVMESQLTLQRTEHECVNRDGVTTLMRRSAGLRCLPSSLSAPVSSLRTLLGMPPGSNVTSVVVRRA